MEPIEKHTKKELIELARHLESEIKDRERTIGQLEEALGSQKRICNTIATYCKERIKPKPIKKVKIVNNRPRVSAVAQWGDWHVGEKTSSQEIGGGLPFDYKTANLRMDKYIEGFTRWVKKEQNLYTVDEIVVQGLGDWVVGDIHEEFADTSEFSPEEQSIKAGQLLALSLAGLRSNLELPLRFVGVPADNHGRTRKKPRYKKKWAWNRTLVVYELAKTLLKDAQGIKWEIPKDALVFTKIQGHGFLCCHGDTIKSWMGIPYYGIARAAMKENHTRTQQGKEPFKYFALGHFHTHFECPGVIMNGALTGTNELDHNQFRSCKPSQNGFMVSPNHGVFDLTHFDLR